MTYKSDQQKNWEDSPRYALLMRRAVNPQTEEDLDSFVEWMEDHLLTEIYKKATSPDEEKTREVQINQQMKQIKELVDLYLWRNNTKVEQAERELLERMKA